MKKVLSGLFAVFLSMTSGYCENVSPINTGANLSDVMNIPVSIEAIIDAFLYDDYDIDTKTKNSIASLIAELATQSKDITLGMIFTTCTNSYAEKNDNTNYLKICTKCILHIAERHNYIVEKEQKKETERMKNTPVFTSEEEYNKVLKTKGYCTEKNTNKFFDITMTTRRSCEKFCRNMAITNACVLEGTYFYDKECQCVDNLSTKGMSVRQWAEFKPYYVRPTWEDYKKLYNIK